MIKRLLHITVLALILSFSLDLIAHAYSIPSTYKPGNEPLDLNYNHGSIQGSFATILILQVIAGGLLYFAAPIAVIMIAMGAFQMVTGGAESEQLEQSKKHLTWTMIGLVVIILSYSIVKFAITFVMDSANPPPSTNTAQPDGSPTAPETALPSGGDTSFFYNSPILISEIEHLHS